MKYEKKKKLILGSRQIGLEPPCIASDNGGLQFQFRIRSLIVDTS